VYADDLSESDEIGLISSRLDVAVPPNLNNPTLHNEAVYCGLAGITGQWNGHDEVAEILPDYDQDTNGDPVGLTYPVDWVLRTDEYRPTHTIHAQASCFLRPGLVYTGPELIPRSQ
jgi:hypothetical protein